MCVWLMTLEMKSTLFFHTDPVFAEPTGVPGTVNGREVSGQQAGSQDSRAGDQAGVRAHPDQTPGGERARDGERAWADGLVGHPKVVERAAE